MKFIREAGFWPLKTIPLSAVQLIVKAGRLPHLLHNTAFFSPCTPRANAMTVVISGAIAFSAL
jgi:hypothetical protein